MNVDPNQLATDLTQFLLPLLPYLVKGIKIVGQDAAKGLGEEIGKKLPTAVQTLITKITGKAKEDAVFKVVAEAAADRPKDLEVQEALTKQFAQLLRDKKFRQEIAILLSEAKKETPDLGIFVSAKSVDGEVTGLRVTDGESFKKSGIDRVIVSVEVEKVNSSGEVKGAEFTSIGDDANTQENTPK